MGLFSRKKSEDRTDLNPTAGSAAVLSSGESTFSEATTLNPDSSGAELSGKRSLYQKYRDLKRGPGTSNLSDEEFKKATGMDRAEFDKWAATAPGVAGGQAAGSITAGGTSGFGLVGTSAGLGGWGREAGQRPKER